jgi:peptide/nickel transport system substrate-binding protein
VPDLAAALPEISSDQKQYTIKLRSDITWHDGEPFSADDVIFTFKLAQNPAYQSPLRLNWNKVDVQKLDDTTVRLTLKEPSAPFAANLTLGILPQHIWGGTEAGNFSLSKYNLQPIGTGPFMIKQVKKTETGEIKSILLAAFPHYQPQRPYLDEVEFKFYQSYDDLIAAYHGREVMGLGYIPFDKKIYVQVSSNISLYSLELPRYQAVFFNSAKSPVLADKNVRAALAQSLNRQTIIDQVYAGAAQPAYGPIPAGSLGYNPGVTKANLFDLDNAKKLLAAAGFSATSTEPVLVKTDKSGTTKLEFTLTTDNFPANVQTAELLRAQWESIGFKVNLQILTLGELQQNYLHPRAYEALLFSESVGADPDPYPYWHSSQRLDPGLNLAMYANKEADQLLVEARTNADPNYRIARYQRFQELVANDIPAIFIVNSLYVYGLSSRVRGLDLTSIANPSERFLDIANWYVKTKRVFKN